MSDSSPLYAAIDLGSNSFHMLVVTHVHGSIRTMAKIKRKVRLAAGLDQNSALSMDAMQRGWDCLALFAERLQDIPPQNIRIVGTAALRVATNIDDFLEKANLILGHEIQVISGKEEAATIYRGVAHTSGGKGKRLVVDIGGASTELIIGQGFDAKVLNSLSMGCVTWLEQFFADRQLTANNFEQAIFAAKQVLSPVLQQYKDLGWDMCVGASGTVQALQEIMLAQGMNEVITHSKLKRLQQQAMRADVLEELEIEGLTLERALVFPSGLSILLAIFESLEIDEMTLAGGALREGMVYQMVDNLHQQDIRARTISSLQQRFQLDTRYAGQVSEAALQLAQLSGIKPTLEPAAIAILTAATQLHEIGLTIDYKKAGAHNAYLLNSLDLPGFTRAQKNLLAEITSRYKETLSHLPEQFAVSQQSAENILRLLRISVLITHRRDASLQPHLEIISLNGELILILDKAWCKCNPLTKAELEIEAHRQSDIGWPLSIRYQ
ncbi:guanosine-5'-triphosphate,3'-diphosphate diphosphatase [Vibrio gallicus]|uniref:guanosine-5'-triphosphate,3'-diphosphate diphosphatase n=1 Tax=Vibrio gallicus TaxID=190897 RepID=UPI0021C35218|nr:guanosine-5'-triphosphate,3'-diphosphate diphosphatase [Vibrio gallicus]